MRIFVAIEVPEDVRKIIDGFQKEISPSTSLLMVPPKNLHLTLFFLGEMEEWRVKNVIWAVKEGSEGISDFTLKLGRPEYYPEWGKVRGLWFNIEGNTGVLENLRQNIADRLTEENIYFDKQKFHPHITIGRAKGKNKRSEFVGYQNVAFKIEKITVFSSKLTSKEPMYGKIEEIDLK